MYSHASAAAIATATVRLFTSDTDKGGLACTPSSHAASGVPRRDTSSADLRLAPTRTALSLGGKRSGAAAGDVLLIDVWIPREPTAAPGVAAASGDCDGRAAPGGSVGGDHMHGLWYCRRLRRRRNRVLSSCQRARPTRTQLLLRPWSCARSKRVPRLRDAQRRRCTR
jgi:hypothetical protein